MSTWASNSFREAAEKRGIPKERIAFLIAEGDRQSSLKLPVLFDLRHLAMRTGVELEFITKVIGRKFDPYREFKIRKRSGTFRTIVAPTFRLKALQAFIHEHILLQQSFSNVSTAFAVGCNPLKNAKIHCGSRWLVKIDASNFFESISEHQARRAFKEIGYPKHIAFYLSRICTRFPMSFLYSKAAKTGFLPQGASTSPLIANLVCRRLDADLAKLAAKYLCAVSRYADDIVFSSRELSRQAGLELLGHALSLLGLHGFSANAAKTQIMPPGSRRIVTGLLVDTNFPRLRASFKESIELHLYHADKRGIAQHCMTRGFRSLIGFRNHLDGLITYAESVDSDFGSWCRHKFDTLPWGMLDKF